MKTMFFNIAIYCALFIINCASLQAQQIYIPDPIFRAWLQTNYSSCMNGDNLITNCPNVLDATVVAVGGIGIADLTGIEAFTALRYLACGSNQLTSLDVSTNNDLKYLYCWGNQLTSLNVSANTALIELDCNDNQLTSLNVSANTALTDLVCYWNQLTSLDVSTNTALIELDCNGNQLTSLNVSANTALTDLRVGANLLTSLDVSANTTLKYLYCYDNQLTSLNVSDNTALITLHCYNNLLTSLNVSANTALILLECNGNQLTSLNVSANIALDYFLCYNNLLTSLNVSANTALIQLECYNNQLTSLDVSANTALTILDCRWNQLTSLDVKNGNNVNFSDFNAKSNPVLSCIQVDDAAYMNTNWAFAKDATANYNDDCSVGIISTDISISANIYPNPSVSGIFNVDISTNSMQRNVTGKISKNSLINAYDVTGRKVLEKICNNGNCILNMNGFATGIYTLVINTDKLTISRRIVITERAVQ